MKKMVVFIAILFMPFTLKADSYRIDIEGPINSVMADFVVQGIEKAQTENASFIVLRLNTPGGFDIAMRRIIEKILSSKIPVIVYVGPSGAHAASAGFFILMAGDLAVMAPGTNTGAAHPILAIGGVYPMEEGKGVKTLTKKATNDAKAYLKGIAEKRGRNIDLAEKAIVDSVSFTANEALDGKLIELIAKDETELLENLKGRKIKLFSGQEISLPENTEKLSMLSMTTRQKILLAISDPNLALLLGLAGLLLLYVEFTNPGMVAPGVLGIISLLLSLIGFSLLPINFIGVLLIILAFGLFVAEIKVQGFGILGIGGIVSMLIGVLILVDAPQPELRITPLIALSVVIPFSVIFLVLLRLAIKSYRKKVETGEEAMKGMVGIAQTAISPDGKVFIRGEYWDAVSREPIVIGKKVKVLNVENLKLIVEEDKS